MKGPAATIYSVKTIGYCSANSAKLISGTLYQVHCAWYTVPGTGTNTERILVYAVFSFAAFMIMTNTKTNTQIHEYTSRPQRRMHLFMIVQQYPVLPQYSVPCICSVLWQYAVFSVAAYVRCSIRSHALAEHRPSPHTPGLGASSTTRPPSPPPTTLMMMIPFCGDLVACCLCVKSTTQVVKHM